MFPARPSPIFPPDMDLHTDEVSTIKCPADVSVEYSGLAVVLTSPLAAGASVVCTGTYTLTAQDIDDLLRTNVVTVEARDNYDYEVEASVTDTVTLDQVN